MAHPALGPGAAAYFHQRADDGSDHIVEEAVGFDFECNDVRLPPPAPLDRDVENGPNGGAAWGSGALESREIVGSLQFAGGPVRLSPQAMHCLLASTWPGNVRELRNAIQRACLLCRGDVIMPEHLPPKIAAAASGAMTELTERGRLSQVERATILATLEECGGNRTQAAKKLGISRRALIYKLRAIESEE